MEDGRLIALGKSGNAIVIAVAIGCLASTAAILCQRALRNRGPSRMPAAGALAAGTGGALARRHRALAGILGLTLATQIGIASAGGAAPEERQVAEVQTAPTRTIKERLSDKASDQQRVDNCKVPPELRGAKPRPDDCRHGASPAPKP